MKFCPNCGEKLEDDSKFCANCGNSVSDNINDKTIINKTSNKSISDIINPILERPKILLLIIVVLILFIGINAIFNSSSNFSSSSDFSSSSSSNIFGGGQDITVYGVNFHIPEGFKYYELAGNPEKETQFSLASPDGTRKIAYIHIKVSDITSAYSAEKSSGNSKVTINGKECYLSVPHGETGIVFCAYDTNGKTVQLNVPKSYNYNNKVISYEETLSQMIK